MEVEANIAAAEHKARWPKHNSRRPKHERRRNWRRPRHNCRRPKREWRRPKREWRRLRRRRGLWPVAVATSTPPRWTKAKAEVMRCLQRWRRLRQSEWGSRREAGGGRLGTFLALCCTLLRFASETRRLQGGILELQRASRRPDELTGESDLALKTCIATRQRSA